MPTKEVSLHVQWQTQQNLCCLCNPDHWGTSDRLVTSPHCLMAVCGHGLLPLQASQERNMLHKDKLKFEGGGDFGFETGSYSVALASLEFSL